MSVNGNSWVRDRDRVTAVGRFLGQRALYHAGDQPSIDLHTAALASNDVETGCRMSAEREGLHEREGLQPLQANGS
jgi:IS5 family transposase